MPADLRNPALKRRKTAHTYFVGRRQSGSAELYAVSASDVERLSADGARTEADLDWRHRDAAALELGRLLLERVVEPAPSPELTRHFARSLLAALPKQGFVLDSDAIWRWVLLANRPQQAGSEGSRTRRSWFARLLPSRRMLDPRSGHDAGPAGERAV